MVSICPFVRFAYRVPLRTGDRHGPRLCYVPSLYYIESGCANVIYEDGSIARLQAGMLLFLQPGTVHTWEIEGDDPFAFRCVFFEWLYRPKPEARLPSDLFCLISEELNDELLDEPLDKGLPDRLVVDSTSTWKGLFEAVTTEHTVLTHEDYPGILAINGHFMLLLHHVYQLAQRQTDYTDPRIAKLIASMERHAGGEYGDVDSWAEALGLSRSHFHSLFRAQSGFTPKRYWNRCRINKAQNDLRSTSDSVTMIAERYGFSSVHTFTKLFHQVVGVAPTVYRQKSRLI